MMNQDIPGMNSEEWDTFEKKQGIAALRNTEVPTDLNECNSVYTALRTFLGKLMEKAKAKGKVTEREMHEMMDAHKDDLTNVRGSHTNFNVCNNKNTALRKIIYKYFDVMEKTGGGG